MVETLPKGELLSISGVGHAPNLVEPAPLAGFERFLGGVPRAYWRLATTRGSDLARQPSHGRIG
jgi:hypothetical protein